MIHCARNYSPQTRGYAGYRPLKKFIYCMFAIIKTGGKQQVVEEGKWILTEKIEQEDGSKIEFEPLLVSNDRETKVGTPTVAGMKVTGTIMEQGRSEKVSIVKYKPKSNYRRRTGHRQPFTKVMIDTIA